MVILSELQTEPRGIYCGAVGHVPPDGNASFNAAIRTAVVDVGRRGVEFGIGSGVVWDSEVVTEYEECLLKGSIIGQDGGIFLSERHFDRLKESADYFDLAFNAEAARRIERGDERVGSTATRAVVDRPRRPCLRRTHTAGSANNCVEGSACRRTFDPKLVWLYHKTTQRGVYESARARSDPGDDVILWNRAQEVTEATTANIVVEEHGRRITPPIGCGLLAGTFRAERLARLEIQERVLMLDDLRSASRLWLINSVHGWREAIIQP
jgi:para-aminobenzoate synthetase/4-amino-4-deoxychorismate lyase